MRKGTTVTRQQKLIEARIASIKRALESAPFAGIFHGDSVTELTYLMGAAHALKWTKNENVYEPATFEVVKRREQLGKSP